MTQPLLDDLWIGSNEALQGLSARHYESQNTCSCLLACGTKNGSLTRTSHHFHFNPHSSSFTSRTVFSCAEFRRKNSFFINPYFFPSNLSIWSFIAWSRTSRAWAGTQVPRGLPPALQGTRLTLPLCRIRLTFPELAPVYM